MWNWNFGDGQTSMVANPEHTYTTPGVHTVTLTASSQTGGSDTKQKNAYITANNEIVGLIASFSAYPTGGTAPLSVEFKDTSIGNPTMWYWEFGDGQTATIANPKHIYTSPGTYTVKLTVSNQVATQTTTIENAIVVLGGGRDFTADFVASPTSGVMPLTVQFTDISSGSPVRWVWEFGDGAISTEQHPRHVYKNAGSYSVKLRVTDVAGFVHETKKQGFINIQAAQPGSYGRVEISFAADRASIILDGKKVGEAEFLKTYTVPSVPPGIHQLRLTKEGFEDFNKEITVFPGRVTKVEGKMTQASTMGGTLSVSTSPDGANVFLDGQPLGTAPIWKPSVSVGSHTLSVTAGNYYDWAREIYVASGEVSYITAVLYPQWWSQDTGVVMASSLLGEGTVFVDGVSIGQSPITISNLEAGIHTIRIETPDHEPWEDTVTVHKGRTSYVVASVD
jgi:PKD repeat protein